MAQPANQHADDRELHILLYGDEGSQEYRAAAAHVETCAACQQRLDTAAGPLSLAAEARELLSDYPWEHETYPGPAGAERPAAPEAGSAWEHTAKPDYLGPPRHPELLGRLGRYDVERVLGAGGMGIVLKAFDTELHRPVAIKVLARHLAHIGAARQRFAREAKAAAAIVHEHVVAIHNVEVDADVPFLVMQYVSGESLQSRVERLGPLDTKEVLRIGIQAALGLAAAHEQGVVHRDVKPANILLENGVERVLLTDFGLARTVDDASLTHTGVVAGTPHYMSPEQANGEDTDHRTDLFSLGAVLYFMATGHPPFRAERAMGVLNRICHDTQRAVWQINPEIPDAVSDVIDRLLAKHPARRPASAAALADELKRLLANHQSPGRRRRQEMLRAVRRYRVQVLASLGVAAALFVLTLSLVNWSGRVSREAGGLDGSRVEFPKAETPSSPHPSEPEPAKTAHEPSALGNMAAESAASSAEVRGIQDKLNLLELSFLQSEFAGGWGQFEQEVELIQRRMDHIDDTQELFPVTR